VLSRDSRRERKLKAIRLAQFRLKQRLEAIDWIEDVLQPEIEALKSGKSVLGLEAGSMFDIVVVEESIPIAPPTTDAGYTDADPDQA
jgi:hypothetical protein